MSNGEVKRIKVYHLRETFCPRALLVDDKSPMPDHESILIQVEDHDRIVAGLKEELEVFRNREYGLENELELKQTIATQALVIGNLKGALEGILVFADDADMRREFARRALEKLAAIEKGV